MLGSISNNLQAWRPATLSKRDSNTGVYCGYYEIFKNSFLIEHLRLLLLTVLPQYSKVSWGVCSLFSRLHVPSILIKNLRKTLLKNSLLSCDQTISSLLGFIDHVLSISEYDLEKHFDEKLTQSVAQITM